MRSTLLELSATQVAIAEQPEIDILSVAIGERASGGGWSLIFQAGLTPNESEYVNNGFSLVNERGYSTEGGVRSLVFHEGFLRISLTEVAATDLEIEPEISISLHVSDRELDELARGLVRIFGETDEDRRPEVIVIPGYAVPRKPGPKIKHRRVECRVLRQMNGLAFVEMSGRSEPKRELAEFLAKRLGVEVDDLVGVRYTCLLEKDRWGVKYSDYRLL